MRGRARAFAPSPLGKVEKLVIISAAELTTAPVMMYSPRRSLTLVASFAALLALGCDADADADGGTDAAQTEGEAPSGGSFGDGDDCGGGDFQFTWSGELAGEASDDCVVTVLSDGTDDGVVPPVVTVSALDESGTAENIGLTLRIHRETEAPIQAILSLRDDVGCNESDVLATGEFDGTVEFTRRDAAGFAITFDINLSCSDETTTPRTDFELHLVGTVEGSRDTL